MKNVILTLACIFGSFLFAQAQQQPDPNGPQFKWIGGDTYDFGTIKEGPQAVHVFEFENTGKQPLILFEATASCGCTTPSFDKQPILPGHKGKIEVHYNTEGRAAPFNKEVYVKSNATKIPVTLYIKGTVVKAKS